jgi:hypothetical protein
VHCNTTVISVTVHSCCWTSQRNLQGKERSKVRKEKWHTYLLQRTRLWMLTFEPVCHRDIGHRLLQSGFASNDSGGRDERSARQVGLMWWNWKRNRPRRIGLVKFKTLSTSVIKIHALWAQPSHPHKETAPYALLLWHDAWMTEVCSQRSTAEMSTATQRLAKTRFCGNEYACINQSVAPN